mmetsp:Transcript_44933/g.108402  ORF Transcript_44933/g.108402 Transcript_44933/m.108402 type:complete len:225 (-) Transcript_44933:1118-1792(-)
MSLLSTSPTHDVLEVSTVLSTGWQTVTSTLPTATTLLTSSAVVSPSTSGATRASSTAPCNRSSSARNFRIPSCLRSFTTRTSRSLTTTTPSFSAFSTRRLTRRLPWLRSSTPRTWSRTTGARTFQTSCPRAGRCFSSLTRSTSSLRSARRWRTCSAMGSSSGSCRRGACVWCARSSPTRGSATRRRTRSPSTRLGSSPAASPRSTASTSRTRTLRLLPPLRSAC